MRPFLFLIFLILTIGALSLYYYNSNETSTEPQQIKPMSQQEANDLQKAKDFLAFNQPEEALEIINKYHGKMESQSPSSFAWLDVYIDALTKSKDVNQLVFLFRFNPSLFKNHEQASLLIAEYFINTNQLEDFEKVRGLWNGNENLYSRWFVLDADRLILEGQSKRAISFLKSHTFKGKDDVNRLVRLAMLNALENPKAAWEYLQDANQKDPTNGEIISYKARLLESVGKNNLAHIEYLKAFKQSPENPFYRDQIAEFYLRHKQYPLALGILKEVVAETDVDQLILKTFFWNRVTTDAEINWNEIKIPKDTLNAYLTYLIHLPTDTFWDQEKFDKISNSKKILKTEQSAFWLRLLSHLKNKEEKEAKELLRFNPFRQQSFNPELTLTLERVLNYRKTGALKEESSPIDLMDSRGIPLQNIEKNVNAPAIFKQIHFLATHPKEKIPADLHELLLSDQIFSALFIAGKWTEAGLELNQSTIVSTAFPEWVAFELTRAMQQNRGNLKALEFALKQKQTPTLDILIAEILAADGNLQGAIERLKPIAKSEGDLGKQAALTLSQYYLDAGQVSEAKQVIEESQELKNSISGKEILARIAVLQNEPDKAERIYTEIQKNSAEAKSYLARKAFAEKNWERAKELTEMLLSEFPDNPMLNENLKKLQAELKSSKTNEATR